MYQFGPVVLAPSLAMVVATVELLYVLRRLTVRGFNRLLAAFAFLLATVAAWSGLQFIRLVSVGVEAKAMWLPATGVVGVLAAVAVGVFALEYTDNSHWVTRRYLAAVAVGTLVLAYLSAVDTGLAVVTGQATVGSLEVLVLEANREPKFFVFTLAGYAHLGVGLYLFGQVLVEGQTTQRVQGVLLTVACGLPGVASTLFWLTDTTPIDLTPSTLVVSAVLFWVAIFRYKVLDYVPVARKNVVREMNEGYLVLDDDGAVLDHNPAAARFFGNDADLIGASIDEVFPDAVTLLDPGPADATTVELDDGRHLRVARSGMAYAGRSGHLLIVTDVTERREREQDLAVLNRILRHDIRNEMTVITTYGDRLRSHVEDDPEAIDDLDHIQDSAENVVGITEDVRDLMRATVEGTTETVPIDAARVLYESVESAHAACPGAEIAVEDDLPDGTRVRATEMLSSVFTNLLHNAVAHNDAATPRVEVRAYRPSNPGGQAIVEVRDNGPGVPPERREEIFGRGEKGLDSDGTGIGLYLVDALVDQYGGEVTVEDNDPEGAVFRVTLPVAEGDPVGSGSQSTASGT